MGRSTLARWRRTREAKGADVYRNVYRRIMIGSGTAAAFITVGIIVAASMAGLEGIELSSWVGFVALAAILGLGLMSGIAWLIQAANRESIRRDLPPVLAATFRGSAEYIADEVAQRIAYRLSEVATEATDRGHARTVAAFREIVTSELICDQLNAATARIHRLGMLTEAKGQTKDGQTKDGQTKEQSNVASIRRT